MILESKNLVVCGVGTGLGAEIVRAAIRDGANVAMGARTESQLELVAKEVDPSGQRTAWLGTDVSDPAQCEALCQLAAARFGGIDGVVQVAALDSVFGGVEDGDLEDFGRTFEINVVGTLKVVRAAIPHLKRRGGGSVVLIGSQAWTLPSTPQVAYGASKGALMTAMLYMAKELGPHRIRVNTVVPTWMWGPPVEMYVKFTAKQRGVSEEEVKREIEAKFPLGEIPADEDVAEAVVFFCSDRSRMISGQSLLERGRVHAVSEVDYAEEGVLEDARQAAGGLSDFGDASFREGLRLLLETYDRNGFSEKGRRRNRRRMVSLLATRLRIEKVLKAHPEIREREIRRPMYLTGLPRTGTSALFNLLGMDPAARPLLLWEGIFPDPPEGVAPGDPDPRVEALRAHYAKGREQNPEFTKIHYTDADRPEECVMLLAHSFCDVQMGIEPLMEPYGSWFHRQDLRKSYAYYADLLRMIDWQRPGERWLLKSPAHLLALDVLIEMFPDVCLVVTHRNPVESVASYCSMMDTLMVAREDFDRKELGPQVLESLATWLERGLAVRDVADPARFVDVDYEDFVADPMKAVHGIYDHFGLELPDASRAKMQAWADENRRGKHGAHEYEMERYGITPDDVKSRLAGYIERYRLPTG